jgi:hypothetical protein
VELGTIIIVINIPLDNGAPILTRPKHIEVPIRNEYTSRKLNPCIRAQSDLGGTVKVPEHRSLGDGAEASVVSSPRIMESSDIVHFHGSLVSVLIIRRNVDENRLANQTLIEFDVDAIFEIQIVTIKGEHL